ncbi:MAG TPA: DinB family protein [Bryobacteraceae bacterium]|nr:DinB family protein [Bryobacteraceae bacterium]
MNAQQATQVISAEALLQHWQGHRRLTRKLIEAFPEDKLFGWSLGGMRPFGVLVKEFLSMSVPIASGVATGQWAGREFPENPTKSELLELWDRDTAELDRIWPTIPPHRFSELDKAFGQYEGTGIHTILYGIDNEIHHRGQGYVYLRVLGVEPPPFWGRD